MARRPQWSPDGRQLASGGNDNQLCVWQLNAGGASSTGPSSHLAGTPPRAPHAAHARHASLASPIIPSLFAHAPPRASLHATSAAAAAAAAAAAQLPPRSASLQSYQSTDTMAMDVARSHSQPEQQQADDQQATDMETDAVPAAAGGAGLRPGVATPQRGVGALLLGQLAAAAAAAAGGQPGAAAAPTGAHAMNCSLVGTALRWRANARCCGLTMVCVVAVRTAAQGVMVRGASLRCCASPTTRRRSRRWRGRLTSTVCWPLGAARQTGEAARGREVGASRCWRPNRRVREKGPRRSESGSMAWVRVWRPRARAWWWRCGGAGLRFGGAMRWAAAVHACVLRRCIRFWNTTSGAAVNCVDTGSQVHCGGRGKARTRTRGGMQTALARAQWAARCAVAGEGRRTRAREGGESMQTACKTRCRVLTPAHHAPVALAPTTGCLPSAPRAALAGVQPVLVAQRERARVHARLQPEPGGGVEVPLHGQAGHPHGAHAQVRTNTAWGPHDLAAAEQTCASGSLSSPEPRPAASGRGRSAARQSTALHRR